MKRKALEGIPSDICWELEEASEIGWELEEASDIGWELRTQQPRLNKRN